MRNTSDKPHAIPYLIGLFLLLASFSCAFAKVITPKHTPVPGGIALVPITLDSKEAPVVEYNKHRVLVVKGENTPWLAIVGIPLTAKAGKHVITVRTPQHKTILFQINDKKYQQQQLHIKNTRKVKPNKKDQTLIKKERQQVKKLLANWSTVHPLETAYNAPVKGPISSQFGLQRLFNGSLKSRHSGLDIAVSQGTEIKAPATGIVLVAEPFFYTGNTIILDHGQGLMTLYAHLNDFTVKPGRHVAKGNVIGHVGRTGRTTGPHLHWGLYLNQTLVDPTLLVNKKKIVPIKKKHKHAKKHNKTVH